MAALCGLIDFTKALDVFIFSDPRAWADPVRTTSAILKRLPASTSSVRPLCLTVISLVILKATLLQEVFYDNSDRAISMALQEHFSNYRYWLAITPEVQSPPYPSRPNQAPDFRFYKGIALTWSQNRPVMVYRDGAHDGCYWFYCLWPTVQPIRSFFLSLQPDLPVMYLYRPGPKPGNRHDWVAHRISLRPIHSIYCAAKDEIMAKVKKHQDTRSRDNWVFEGPPGVGKTSMALAVAAKLNQPLYSFPMMSKQMTDGVLQSWLISIPPDAVVLIDDAEYPFPEKVSNACVLDFLDGTMAASHPGRLLIVNTNSQGFVRSLPGPLQRAGRLSETFRFTWATPKDAEAMFAQEFQGSLLEEQKLRDFASAFGAQVEGKDISHAAIELYLRNHTVWEAVENAGSLSADAPNC